MLKQVACVQAGAPEGINKRKRSAEESRAPKQAVARQGMNNERWIGH